MSRPTEIPPTAQDTSGGKAWALSHANRRFAAWTGGYAGVIAALVIASSIVSDRAAVVVYGVAVVLTMPVGTGVVPALWVNAFAAALLGNVAGIQGASLDRLMQVGVVVTFMLMAVGNAWIVRQLWQAVRRLSGKG